MPPTCRTAGGLCDSLRFQLQEANTVYPVRLADSHASTFLSVAHYYEAGDAEYVRNNKAAIDTVAGVIDALQDEDGLVRVAPTATKYLADNAENPGSLIGRILLNHWDTRMAERVQVAGRQDQEGIETIKREGDDYAWSYNWLGKRYQGGSIRTL